VRSIYCTSPRILTVYSALSVLLTITRPTKLMVLKMTSKNLIYLPIAHLKFEKRVKRIDLPRLLIH